MAYRIIYRVVDKKGPFVSAWVLSKKQAVEIMENVKNNIIFGGGSYEIEESSLLM